jgi:hypothetical protein
MPRYISLHTLGCLPKPAFASLCKALFASSGAHVIRVCAGQIAEKMLVEFEAESQESAIAWLRSVRLTAAWLMRVDYDCGPGGLHEL